MAFAVHHNTEPVYQNRTLAAWLRDDLAASSRQITFSSAIGNRWEVSESNTTLNATAEAMKHIGPDAIPFLVEWSQADDSPIRAKVVNWLNALKYVHIQVDSAGDRHAMAHLGFTLLGNNAKPAWPALIRLTSTRNSEHRYWAFYCLLACQPDRETLRPVVARLIHDPDTTLQFFAAHVFHDRFPEEAGAAGVYKILPFLKENPTNSPATNNSAPSK